MQTFNIYGRLYCRGDEETFEATITEEQLFNINAAIADDDDEALEDFFEDDWNVASLIIEGIQDGELDVAALINKGEAQAIFLEEYAGGIGVTVRDAKIAFVDAEES